MTWAWDPLSSFLYNNLIKGVLLPGDPPGPGRMDLPPQVVRKIWNYLSPADQNSLSVALRRSETNPNGNMENDNEEGLKIGDRVVWLWHGVPNSDLTKIQAGSYPAVIRWTGDLRGTPFVGVEFDQCLGLNSGRADHVEFNCKPGYGGFLLPICLIPEADMNIQLPTVPNTTIRPPLREVDLHRITDDRPYGIQGQLNSCYMDTTIFSMFAFSSVFDSILTGAPWQDKKDVVIETAETAQGVLRQVVVNPLRKNIYNSDTNMSKLRKILGHLDSRFVTNEMDPQEFMEILFREVFHLDGFISLASGEVDYLNQLLCQENSDNIPTVQELFDESVRFQDLKFKSVPTPALILQMPRSGPDFKMFRGILPNLSLNISDVLDGENVIMDLFAVICIETNHFVTFVKCGKERLAPWVLFNSMARREVLRNSEYFVPMIWVLPNMGKWLERLEKEPNFLKGGQGAIPVEVHQLLSDPYICFYAPAN